MKPPAVAVVKPSTATTHALVMCDGANCERVIAHLGELVGGGGNVLGGSVLREEWGCCFREEMMWSERKEDGSIYAIS